MFTFRAYESTDWHAVWKIIEPVFREGKTYAFSPHISEAEAHKAWIERPVATYVAVSDADHILGTYYIKPNQPTLGAHVCNCGYIVGEAARGKGVASAMCEHSQREAVRLGFKAMQFNLVVATNTGAIRLWHKLGFETVGVLPEAFHHATAGFVDAFVMYKRLDAPVE
ncbi:MAG: GNAT family N-acetyltransferase [Cyanobacteria bacterium J06560_2]